MASLPHWRAPIVLVTAWTTTLLLMFGHHFWYKRFHHTSVKATAMDLGLFEVSQQQFNLAIGTAIAFCVKVSSVACVTTAYAQMFWIWTATRPLTVHGADTLLGVVSNGFLLFWLRVWKGHFLLFATGVIMWYVLESDIVADHSRAHELL